MIFKNSLFQKLIFPFIVIIIFINLLNILLLSNFFNLDVNNLIQSSQLLKVKIYLIKILFLTTFLSTILVIIIYIFYIKKYVIFPINKIIRRMENIENPINYQKIKPLYNDELGVLTEKYNFMMEKLKDNSEKIYNYQEKYFKNEKINLLENLSSGLSHELNNPLNNMTLYLNVVKKYVEDKKTDKIDEVIDKIRKELNRIENISLKFAEFSHLNINNKTKININLFLNEIINQMNYIIKTKNIEIKITNNIQKKYIEIMSDSLEYILLNILKNACEVSEYNSIIDFSCLQDEKHYIFKIKDYGSGISEEDKTKIFEPFYSSKKNKNSGLGLAISKELLRISNGELSVENNKNSKGVTFTLLIPK